MSSIGFPRKIWPRDRIITDEGLIPPIIRFIWIEARECYESEHYIGALLLASMAVEISLRDFLKNLLDSAVGRDFTKFLELLEYRHMLEFLEELKWPKEILSRLHKLYDIRNKYAHAKISTIVTGTGKEEAKAVAKAKKVGKGTEEELFEPVITVINAAKDSMYALEKAEQLLRTIFIDRAVAILGISALLRERAEKTLFLILFNDIIEESLQDPNKTQQEKLDLRTAQRAIPTFPYNESKLYDILRGRPIMQKEYDEAKKAVDDVLARLRRTYQKDGE